MQRCSIRWLPLVSLALVILTSPAAVLAAADESAPGHFVEVEKGKIYYDECGTGPDAVVLIHDGIAHSAVWDAVWPAFCKEFHTVRYDRRGYGRSPAATTWYYETDDLFTLLRHLKINRAFLVGSSHGGEPPIITLAPNPPKPSPRPFSLLRELRIGSTAPKNVRANSPRLFALTGRRRNSEATC